MRPLPILFSNQNFVCISHLPHVQICHSHLTLLDLLALIMLGEMCKLQGLSLLYCFLHSRSGPNIILSRLFPYTLMLCSSSQSLCRAQPRLYIKFYQTFSDHSKVVHRNKWAPGSKCRLSSVIFQMGSCCIYSTKCKDNIYVCLGPLNVLSRSSGYFLPGLRRPIHGAHHHLHPVPKLKIR
jgi:hypothetical protein